MPDDHEPPPQHSRGRSTDEQQVARAMLDVTTDPVFAIDPEEGFTRINEAFLSLTGYEREQLLGRDPSTLIHAEDREEWTQRLEVLAQESASTSERWVSRLVSQYGTAIPVEWQIQSAGEMLVGRATDEREDEHQKRKLEVLNRALRHNIRNQMNIVIGKATTLQDVDDEGYRTAAAQIEEIGKNVVNISDKARRAQEHVEIPPDEECQIEVTDAIETVVTQFAISYPGATVRTTLPEGAPARAPPSFDVALSELLENAVIHHPSDGGEIEVACRTDDQWVHVEVRDECEPVPQQVRETIHRGTEQPLHHNDGLGLWIVRWVVDAVDGELAFDRRSDPPGNVVRLSFERIDPDG